MRSLTGYGPTPCSLAFCSFLLSNPAAVSPLSSLSSLEDSSWIRNKTGVEQQMCSGSRDNPRDRRRWRPDPQDSVCRFPASVTLPTHLTRFILSCLLYKLSFSGAPVLEISFVGQSVVFVYWVAYPHCVRRFKPIVPFEFLYCKSSSTKGADFSLYPGKTPTVATTWRVRDDNFACIDTQCSPLDLSFPPSGTADENKQK